ncbi:MAG: hypothetical protein ACRC42_02950 [Mycoplasma sp.]
MQKPKNINFSSGPCSKRANWQPPLYSLSGRSHRSSEGLSKIQEIIGLQKKVLSIPDSYYVAIVSASSSGVMETLLWSLLGQMESMSLLIIVFSVIIGDDIVNELQLNDVRLFKAKFPKMMFEELISIEMSFLMETL